MGPMADRATPESCRGAEKGGLAYGRFAALERRRPWLVQVGRSHVGSSSVANRNSEDRSDGGGATSATQHGAIPLPSCPIYSAGHRRLGDRRDETRAQIQICAPDVEQTASNDRAGYLPFQCNQNQIWIAKSVPCCSTFLARLFLPQMSSLSHSSSSPPPYKFPAAIRSPPFISD